MTGLLEVYCGACESYVMVNDVAADRVNPGYYDRDECPDCGNPLDFSSAEPYAPDPDALHDFDR